MGEARAEENRKGPMTEYKESLVQVFEIIELQNIIQEDVYVEHLVFYYHIPELHAIHCVF